MLALYEYHFLITEGLEPSDMIDALNAKATEGWRVVTSVSGKYGRNNDDYDSRLWNHSYTGLLLERKRPSQEAAGADAK